MKKLFFLLTMFIGIGSFAFSQDSDNDGVADGNDCAPTDPTKWASIIYLDLDGDGYNIAITGCFGGTLPVWSAITPIYNVVLTVGYSYYEGQGWDGDEYDAMSIGDAAPHVYASGDADNDGEPDFTDPQPYNASINHMTLDICNGIDDNFNGIVDEDCHGCAMTVDAGADGHLYFGYSPQQCITKTAIRTGGNPPFSYIWNLNRPLLPGESMTGASSASVNICLMDTAEICVTVSDANNCTTTDCAMINAEDVRCFTGNSQKVSVCHNGKTICVDENALSAHLGHGDYIGSCNPQRFGFQSENLQLALFPNPSSSLINLRFTANESSAYYIKIYDMVGHEVLSQAGVATEESNHLVLDVSTYDNGIYQLHFEMYEKQESLKLTIAH